ncbi:hypothetical protein E2C01_004994 [Portunus trituberculatus]|uniref:Uncharacterized protein n=1 Tax=Portunus trituberculatus TaxID=210409 RepID=A0A5B7CS03_PORTR|nr:hypothetical protein [Portunus trituberculatus]
MKSLQLCNRTAASGGLRMLGPALAREDLKDVALHGICMLVTWLVQRQHGTTLPPSIRHLAHDRPHPPTPPTHTSCLPCLYMLLCSATTANPHSCR